jgi:hypothetical protein
MTLGSFFMSLFLFIFWKAIFSNLGIKGLYFRNYLEHCFFFLANFVM